MKYLALVLAALSPPAAAPEQRTPPDNQPPFSVVEATIPDMQKAMQEGRTTSRRMVEQYLQRIALYEDKLNAVMTVNPKALEEADRLDQEHKAGKIRGPLHGIPIALKDNIHTTDMPTTGGAIAFEGLMPPYDATLTKNLRDAGAVIIAKTTLTELANFVANGMPGNYNALAGYAHESVRSAPRSATGHRRRPAGAEHRRLELRRRHGRQFLGRQRRYRDVGIDPQPGEPEHARRHQADRRPHQPLRRDSDHRRSGHGRADGEDGDRRGDPVRRARKRVARSERSRRPRRARRRRTATTRRS